MSREQQLSHARKLVLCFDGTGNKFRGDDSDSNILKIFRMLDRTADDQYHYYQPGIGTYIVSKSLSHTSVTARLKSWYMKAKDTAFGLSFDQHVVGGYRFLMRFYNPGDEIYIFGFSRGAYVARFLAEMLDYIGLLTHGNEEMVHFAWKAFSQWQRRRDGGSPSGSPSGSTKRDMYDFMKGFRETFSRPVQRIQFLGLFDTVNSVPRFETAWMKRSKFPYTARTSARVVRHAVSIDERRAKFRQDLIYQSYSHRSEKAHRDPLQLLHDVHEMYRAHQQSDEKDRSSRVSVASGAHGDDVLTDDIGDAENPAPFRPASRSRAAREAPSLEPSRISLSYSYNGDRGDLDQDIMEVFFSGDHSDVGGGWDSSPDAKSASHVPLTWMVREAMRAGLPFDVDKLAAMQCSTACECQGGPGLDELEVPHDDVMGSKAKESLGPQGRAPPDILINNEEWVAAAQPSGARADAHGSAEASRRVQDSKIKFHEILRRAHTAPIHDSLEYKGGLGFWAVTSWKLMEYLPFLRMDLQPDGSWKPIRWPLPGGEVRDIPDNVNVHGSVIARMKHDPSYRPGNLIIGGGGRGCRVAPSTYGMGEWECVAEEGDPVGEIWVKKRKTTG